MSEQPPAWQGLEQATIKSVFVGSAKQAAITDRVSDKAAAQMLMRPGRHSCMCRHASSHASSGWWRRCDVCTPMPLKHMDSVVYTNHRPVLATDQPSAPPADHFPMYLHAADIDMFRRAKMMDPPLKEHQWLDVQAVHGKRTDTSYWPGAWLPDDPHVKEEKDLTHFTGVETESGVVLVQGMLGCGEVATGAAAREHVGTAGYCRVPACKAFKVSLAGAETAKNPSCAGCAQFIPALI